MELVCIGIFKWFLPIKGLKLHSKAMPQFTVQSAKGKATFLQNNLFKLKNGTQKITKTNHYIIPSSNHVLQGGKEFQPDKYLTDTIQVMRR